jgi:hypothetical protein
MTTAMQGDFFGGGAPLAAPKVLAFVSPDDRPNVKNAGGVSNNEIARRKNAELGKQQKAALDAAKAEQGRKMIAARAAEYKRRGGFIGIALKDGKVLGPVALKAAGVAASVIATGGAAAGALGAVSAASVVAGATTASKVIDAVGTGAKVANAVSKKDPRALASLAKSGLDVAGVKLPLPSAAAVGKDVMAGLKIKLPKVALPKVALPKITLPKITLPKVALPKVNASTAAIIKLAATPTSAAQKAAAAAAKGKANVAHLKKQAAGVVAPKIGAGPAFAVKAAVKAIAAARPAAVMKPPAVKLTTTVKPPTTASIGKAKNAFPMALAITKKNVAIKSNRPAPSSKMGFPGRPSNDPVVAPKGAASTATRPSAAPSITQDGFFIPRSGADAGRVLRTGAKNAGRVA